LLPHGQHRFDKLAEIDRFEAGARQLGIEPGRLGDIDDQPVEPPDVVPDDVEESLA
jgi:hypothetical protein